MVPWYSLGADRSKLFGEFVPSLTTEAVQKDFVANPPSVIVSTGSRDGVANEWRQWREKNPARANCVLRSRTGDVCIGNGTAGGQVLRSGAMPAL
eukprot:1229051-Rhodomonas_salina.1